ncbi:MAG: ribosome biogenesis GTPase Der [Acidobacteriales bacterium]|nr:ribosome biogenesis GTPase Der [Terriglobales bacterium]
MPTLAIVGRPNVGKSTLFNRLVGQRRSIVGDEPGITRDRIYGTSEWNGRTIRVVDTGGILPDDKELIPTEIYRQARTGIGEADAIVMVVDGRAAITAPDMELARILLRSGKPVFLAVNKMETDQVATEGEEFRRLAIRDVFFISAEHGRNIMDLLEAAMAVMPPGKTAIEEAATAPQEVEVAADGIEARSAQPDEIKIAIIGRPNVGKSTLLNRLTGSDRAIVSPVAGTTRDAVDELMVRDGRKYRFIDTAGIRRKGKTHLMAEKLSVVMARKHLEAADIALLMIDAPEGVTSLDANIGGYAHDSGRSVIIVVNKWDLVTTHRTDGRPPADRVLYEEQVRRVLKYLDYAPVLFVSAAEGKNVDKIFKALEKVAAERYKRITTGQMNRFLKSVDFERASVPANKRVRIYYMTQAHVAPPTFILFTDREVKLHFSYERFLMNQIRAAFGFNGTPIWIKTRISGKDRKKK